MPEGVPEAETVAKQREIFDRERQLKIGQQALDAAVAERGYDHAESLRLR